MRTKKMTSLSINKKILSAVDARAKRDGLNRSAFIENVLKDNVTGTPLAALKNEITEIRATLDEIRGVK